MGFFSKLKKVFKFAAPIAASFIPGVGGVLGKVLGAGKVGGAVSKIAPLLKKTAPFVRTAKGAVQAVKRAGGRVLPGVGHVGNVAYAGDVAYRVGSKVYRDLTRKRKGTGSAGGRRGATTQIGYFAASTTKKRKAKVKRKSARRRRTTTRRRSTRKASAAQLRARANFVRRFVRRR